MLVLPKTRASLTIFPVWGLMGGHTLLTFDLALPGLPLLSFDKDAADSSHVHGEEETEEEVVLVVEVAGEEEPEEEAEEEVEEEAESVTTMPFNSQILCMALKDLHFPNF
jgi:hypothetical protein